MGPNYTYINQTLTQPTSYHLIVIGGGAAGFFTALRAAEVAPHSKIMVLEGSTTTLNKVRISGGGRCNVTHACFDPGELVANYPRGERELLGPFHKFAPGDTIDWFEQRGVETKIEEDGRMFPITDSSESIASCLEEEAEKLGVEIRLSQRVNQIRQEEHGFSLQTKDGNHYQCAHLMVATGGQPAMWELLEELGHEIVSPVPSLFTLKIKSKKLPSLAGISVSNAKIRFSGFDHVASGPVLITHEGLSGPGILRLSAWGARAFSEAGYQGELLINWLGRSLDEIEDLVSQSRQDEAKKAMGARGFGDIPHRLWSWLLGKSGIPLDQKWADLSNPQKEKLVSEVAATKLWVHGKSTFKEEFVTAGGLELSEIDFRRFESKILPGFFMAGEVLNIDAITGGFNFQAAWTGGWLAGSEIGKRINTKKATL